MRKILFSFLALSVMFASFGMALVSSVDTYSDNSYTVLKDVFAIGETVYAHGAGTGDSVRYAKIEIYDSSETLIKTCIETFDPIYCEYELPAGSDAGMWTLKFYHSWRDCPWSGPCSVSLTLLDTINFEVTAPAVCGDGIVAGSEECDGTPGCLSDCTLEVVPEAYAFRSTNDDNRDGTNSYRPGVIGPHVDLVSATMSSVTLDFIMPENYVACFEYRSDGDTSQVIGTNYNTGITDGLYPYFCVTNTNRVETISADEYVEVRSVFGGERDWDFDWTRFDVLPDMEGPEFNDIHAVPEWPGCTNDFSIFSAITDVSGIKPYSTFLHYRYSGIPAWQNKLFTIPANGDVYEILSPVDHPNDGEELEYYIESSDNLNNVGYSGSQNNFMTLIYDCASPVAGVTGMGDWTSVKTAEVSCTDSASGCDDESYRLYVSSTEIVTCPTDKSVYTLMSPSTVSAYSWVCSYAKDKAGNSDFSEPEEFLVDGISPTAEAGGPYNCNEGETISLDGSSSFDEDGKDNNHPIESYYWSNGGDVVNPDYTCGNGNAVETVSLTVTDHVGREGSDSASVNVANVAPVLDELNPFSCNEGETITLTASATDFSGDALTYMWDTDADGVYDDSATFSCVEGPTSVSISVKVLDDENAEDIGSTYVDVSNVAPVVDAGEDQTVDEGDLVTIAPTITDAGVEDTRTVSINWGDGTTNSDFTHAYADNGVYTVTVTATDDDGDAGSDSLDIKVLNVAPVVDAGEDASVDEGDSVRIAPTFSDAGTADTHTATVSWGDGSATENIGDVTSPMSLTHTYCTGGSHTVTVRVSDDDGGFGEDTLIVTVENVAPTIISSGGPYFGVVGEWITFTAEATDACGNTALTYSWDFSPEGNTHWSPNVASWDDRFDGVVVLTVSDGIDSVSAEVPVTIFDYSISLEKGWNLISIPLIPEEDDTDIESVFGSVVDDLELIWAYKWDETQGKNVWTKHRVSGEEFASDADLTNVVPGYGYYVKMAEERELFLNGKISYQIGDDGDDETQPSVIGMVPSVTLATNSWNLIGKYGLRGSRADDDLVSLTVPGVSPWVSSFYDIIYDKNGYHPNWLSSTEGYWLSMKLVPGAETIEYKANYEYNCRDR
jgi:hypothetical protein